MSPSELYVPYMNAVKEKIYISKAVIELLTEDNDASYEDLMNKLHVRFSLFFYAFTYYSAGEKKLISPLRGKEINKSENLIL